MIIYTFYVRRITIVVILDSIEMFRRYFKRAQERKRHDVMIYTRIYIYFNRRNDNNNLKRYERYNNDKSLCRLL